MEDRLAATPGLRAGHNGAVNDATYADARQSLDSAIGGFRERLGLVDEADWGRPTPCEGWTVSDLVKHLIGGGIMTELLLDGSSADEAFTALFDLDLDGDLRAEFERSAARQHDAFERPGAANTIVHHPLRDMPASDFIWMRVRDTLVHTWDLARAIDADPNLDPDLVATVWAQVEPLAPLLAGSGMFGGGASGSLPEDASIQDRLLDALGRRP